MASDNQADVFNESPTFSQDVGHFYFMLGHCAGYKKAAPTAPAPREPAESQESHDMCIMAKPPMGGTQTLRQGSRDHLPKEVTTLSPNEVREADSGSPQNMKGGKDTIVGGMVTPRRYVHILTPGMYEGNLLW